MEMTEKEVGEFNEVLKDYLDDPRVRKMKDYVAHGSVNVLSHSLNVARTAYMLNKRFKANCDLKTLLTGALLHDFYQYDWHNARLSMNVFKMHGFTHPEAACENAVKEFGVDERVQEVIRCHMWPLTLRSMPRHKEAILVCIADKLCATKETVRR